MEGVSQGMVCQRQHQPKCESCRCLSCPRLSISRLRFLQARTHTLLRFCIVLCCCLSVLFVVGAFALIFDGCLFTVLFHSVFCLVYTHRRRLRAPGTTSGETSTKSSAGQTRTFGSKRGWLHLRLFFMVVPMPVSVCVCVCVCVPVHVCVCASLSQCHACSLVAVSCTPQTHSRAHFGWCLAVRQVDERH